MTEWIISPRALRLRNKRTITMTTHAEVHSKYPTTLDCLPDEVLQHILYYVSPSDILVAIQQVSKRFNRLAREPLLWRYNCRIEYKYWDSKHRIRQKLAGSVGDVDWRHLFIHRKNIDRHTTDLLEGILRGQMNRIQKYKAITRFGYDAKDTLLRHCHATEDSPDVLARRCGCLFMMLLSLSNLK